MIGHVEWEEFLITLNDKGNLKGKQDVELQKMGIILQPFESNAPYTVHVWEKSNKLQITSQN